MKKNIVTFLIFLCAVDFVFSADVILTEEGFFNFDCPESEQENINKKLSDSDGDGIPDNCDKCPKIKNSKKPGGHGYEPCPSKESLPVSIQKPNCGEIEKSRTPPAYFLTPQWVGVSTELDSDSIITSNGFSLTLFIPMGNVECKEEKVKGTDVHALMLDYPEAYFRVNLHMEFSLLGGDIAINYMPQDSWFALGLGPAVFWKTFEKSLYLGPAVRIGIFNVVSLSPIILWDVIEPDAPFYGAMMQMDWKVFKDLGL